MYKVFNLKVDQTQNIDDFPNVHKINNEDYPDISQVLASAIYDFKEDAIVVRANLRQIAKYDFLTNDLNIPILSKRFAELIDINSIKEIKSVPLLLLDDTYLDTLYDKEGILKKDILHSKEFVSLNFNHQFDFCDIEKSTFRKLRSNPNSSGILRKAVLKLPKHGFPSLFRISETISKLFVSAEAKELLDAANIKGCVFEPVETT